MQCLHHSRSVHGFFPCTELFNFKNSAGLLLGNGEAKGLHLHWQMHCKVSGILLDSRKGIESIHTFCFCCLLIHLKKLFLLESFFFFFNLSLTVWAENSESALKYQWGNLLVQSLALYLNYAAWVDLQRSFGHWEALQTLLRCLMETSRCNLRCQRYPEHLQGQLDLTQDFGETLPPLEQQLGVAAYQIAS